MDGKDAHETVVGDKCIALEGNWTDETKLELDLDGDNPVYSGSFRPNISKIDDLQGCSGCASFIDDGVTYEAQYKCGNSGVVKIVESSDNENADFTCIDENGRCKSGELRVYDNGTVGFFRNKLAVESVTYKSGLKSLNHSSSLRTYRGRGSYTAGKEYTSFKIGEELGIGEFIGSPNGTFFIKLQRDEAGNVTLVGGRMESSCINDENKGYFADKPGCVAPYKMAAGNVKTDKRNQLAYVSTFDELRWFDRNPTDLSDEYYSAGNYTMSPGVTKTANIQGISKDICENKCNNLADCHGYVYSGPGTCDLYSQANMFPNNLHRLGPVADANMFVRLKKISNSGNDCSTSLVGVPQDMISGLSLGARMKENSKCRISEFTEEQQSALDRASLEMDEHAGVMAKQAVSIVKDNESLEKATYETVIKQQAVETEMAALELRRQKSAKNHATVLGMDESAALDMLSSNYQALMFATVGIGVAAACMHFAR
jgi:hypothetical protein